MSLNSAVYTASQLVEKYASAVSAYPLLIGQSIADEDEVLLPILQQALLFSAETVQWAFNGQIANTLALFHFARMNLVEAQENAEIAIAALSHLERNPITNQSMACSLGRLATIEYYLGDVDDALVHARECQQLVVDNDLSGLKGYILGSIGAMLCYLGNYADALEPFEQAQQTFTSLNDKRGLVWLQLIHAREHSADLGNMEQVIQSLEALLPTLQADSAYGLAIEGLLTLAAGYLYQNQLDKADQYLQTATKLIDQKRCYWYRPEAALIKARLAFLHKNLPQARKAAYNGLGFVGDQGDVRILAALYRLIAAILEQEHARFEEVQDAFDRSLAIARTRSRRLELALTLRQAGTHRKIFANRGSMRARGSGYLFEAERVFNELKLSSENLHHL